MSHGFEPRGFAALTREYGLLPPGGRVLCAISGGADSVCLLHLLRARVEQDGFSLFAAHYDHRLRGEESARDAAFVARLCRAWEVPLTLGSGDVAGEARRCRAGLEETARRLRYAFLRETAQALNCSLIATAHNADDNTETVLLHLIRGTGLQGLSGMAPRRDGLIRPLLTTSREEIEDYLRAHSLSWVEDSSNTDLSFTRNRVRHQLVPLLQQFNPRFSQRMEQTIRSLRADQELLSAQAAQLAQAACRTEEGLRIEARLLAQAPEPIAVRTVRLLLAELGEENCSAAHLNAILALARGENPSACAVLPGGRRVRRIYEDVLFPTRDGPETFSPVPLVLDGETCPPGALWRCRCRRAVCPEHPAPDICYLTAFRGTPVLRPRQTGDRIQLPGRPAKTLKKLFTDHKLPRADRERLPVLADEDGPAALPRFGPSADRLARPGEEAWEVQFLPATDNNRQ